MTSLLRLLLTGALLFGLMQAARNAGENPQAGDLTNALWTAYCVIVGLLVAIAWAPWIGSRIADPATGILTNSTYVDRPNRMMQTIRWLERRRQRRLVCWLCFIEGVRHPWLPAHFVTGMRHAAPGSWLELAFAREVYRFNNVDNCVQAYGILRRHGRTPPPHAKAEVNLVLMSLEHAAKPAAAAIEVPPSAPPPLQRNPRIQLFDQATPAGPPPADAASGGAEDTPNPR